MSDPKLKGVANLPVTEDQISDSIVVSGNRKVKFITSLAMQVVGIGKRVAHVQFTVCQYYDTKDYACFFDVVDPSKIKLQDDGMRES